MTYGAYAGVLGAGLGALMGVAAGIIQLRIVYPGWPADIPWLTVARTCDVALGGAVLCSAVPAWLAARAPLSTGMAGGASDRIVRWPPWMAVGPSALAILVVFAVIVRTAPAVAAMAAVSMCVTTVGMLYSAEAQRAVAEVRLIHPHPTIMVNAGQDVIDTTVQSLRDIKEPSATYQVYSAEQAEPDVGSRYGDSTRILLEGRSRCEKEPRGASASYSDPVVWRDAAKKCALEMAAQSAGFHYTPLSQGVFVVSESDLDLWTTTSDAARDRAKEAIRSGGIVLPEGYGIEGTGRPTVVATEYRDNSGSDSAEATQVTGIKSAQLPAVEALPLTNATTILLSPEAAQALGVEARFTGAALTYEKFGWKDARANEEAISALGDRALVETEHAQENWGSWPWAFALALGALAFVIMILVIALSAPGQRRDASALHDVGAPPELAAHAAAIQAGATTLAGLLTGAVLGHLGAWVYTGRAEVTLAGDVLRRGLSDFLELSWQILFMSLVTAVAVAGVAWWVQRPWGAQRDDAAEAAREPAPHSLI